MSEEEIIKILKDYSNTNPFQKNMFYVSNLHEAIQGLLDLYNREKERHKKTEKSLKGQIQKYNLEAQQYFDTTIEQALRFEKEIEKKDEIIYEIAKAFKQDDIRSTDEIIEYFTKLVEEETNESKNNK